MITPKYKVTGEICYANSKRERVLEAPSIERAIELFQNTDPTGFIFLKPGGKRIITKVELLEATYKDSLEKNLGSKIEGK